MVKALRIYYTCFDESRNKEVISKLKALIGFEPIVHNSFIREFRYLEFRGDEAIETKKSIVKETVKNILGPNSYIRIDYINI